MGLSGVLVDGVFCESSKTHREAEIAKMLFVPHFFFPFLFFLWKLTSPPVQFEEGFLFMKKNFKLDYESEFLE